MSASARARTARTVEVGDPGELIARLPEASGFAWVREGEGMVAWGEAVRVEVGTGEERFARASAALSRLFEDMRVDDAVGLPGTGPVAFGGFTFDPAVQGSVLVVPRVVLGRRGGRAWVTTVGADPVGLGPVQALPAPGRIRYAGASGSETRWMEAVDAAVRAIDRGELDKVVLARDVRVWAERPLDPRALVHRLAERFPQCFSFSCAGMVGATPELLVRRLGDRVDSVPLAGSAARGPGPGEDARLGDALLASEKNRGEHQLAVDSVRAVLEPLCVSLDVDATPWLLRLGNVQHLATSLRGVLHRPIRSLDLAGALHPTAAVCGTPTATALDRIRTLEGMDRGRYAGPVGWTDARGDGEWAIALRCAALDGPRARLFAGAGLVAGSLPELELEETRLKLLAMQSALEG